MADNLPALSRAADSVLNMIARAASDPAVDIGKLEALMAMQERVLARENARLFASDMAEAQAEMEPVIRDAVNPFIGNKYARLEAIDKEIRPIYTQYGFSVRYRCDACREGAVKVVCIVSHRAGHTEEFPIEAPLDAAGSKGQTNKPAVQAVGSTITYLRRYALTMAFNVVMENDSDDDDGEANRRTARAPDAKAAARADPKAIKWKEDVIALFGQAQSEKGVAALWTKIAAQYDVCRTTWPDTADEIDAAGRAALDRVRQPTSSAPPTDPEISGFKGEH